MENMQSKINDMCDENLCWRHKYDALKKFATDNKIPIPPELENP